MNVSKISPSLHYSGKILKQRNKFYTGSFFKTLNSGKSLCLTYDEGLLKYVSRIIDGQLTTKSYKYDSSKKLINVNCDGENIFTKIIKNKIGINFHRIENINENIHKVYDEENNLIQCRILPKSIISEFSRFYFPSQKTDVLKEDRFFISNLVKSKGNYYLKSEDGCYTEPQLVWFKSIFKELNSKRVCVIDKKDNKMITTIKDAKGSVIANATTQLDKNNKPMCGQITDSNGLNVDLQYFNSEEKEKQRIIGILNVKNFKFALDNVFDKNNNLIYQKNIEPLINGDTKQISIFERKFDENNLLTEEKKYKEIEGEKQLIYKIKNKYNHRGQLINKEYYNGEELLETAEFNVYDKNGILRISEFKNYDESLESGYDVYDKKGLLRKRAIQNSDESYEEIYDRNGLYTKFILKDENGKIIHIFKYSYNDTGEKVISTVKKDGKGNVLYSIIHEYAKDKEIRKYFDKNGEFVGKQFLYSGDELPDAKYIYTDNHGKRCKYENLAKILDDYDI